MNDVPTFELAKKDEQLAVVCSLCKKEIDVVPDARTAYCRSGLYGEHKCKTDN